MRWLMKMAVRSSRELPEPAEHLVLDLRVERAGGLVEDDDGGVAEEGAGEGHAPAQSPVISSTPSSNHLPSLVS